MIYTQEFCSVRMRRLYFQYVCRLERKNAKNHQKNRIFWPIFAGFELKMAADQLTQLTLASYLEYYGENDSEYQEMAEFERGKCPVDGS